MKKETFIVMILFVSWWVSNGCRKDEAVFFQDYQTNLRSDSLYDYYKGFVLPDGSIISRRPATGEFYCLQNIPEHTWNGLAVIDLIIRYENLKCNAPDSVNAFGTPVWSLTMDSTSNGKNITIVPLVDENENLSGLFSVLKSNAKDTFLFKQRSVMDSTEIEFLNIILGKQKHWSSSCDFNWKINKESWKRFWNNLGDFFDSIFEGFDIGGAGSPGGGGGWMGGGTFSGSFSNNGSTITGAGGSSGGGTTANIIRYLRPFAGYQLCDPRLKTVEGCKKFFKDHIGAEISTPDLEEKIKTCGCFSAVLFVDHEEWENVNEPKQRCLLCDGNAFLNGGYGQTIDKLFNVMNHTEFPCTEVSQENLDAIKDELLGDICTKVAYDHNYYPGKILNDYIAKLNQLNIPYLTRSNNHAGLDAASDAIIKMGSLFGMNPSEVKNLTNDQICRKLEVADCLLPKFLNDSGFNTGDEEIERDKEQFWDMIQTRYYDPCNGEEINFDDTILELCQQNKISGSALIHAIDGVDYINIDESFINGCPKFKCIYNHLYLTGNTLFCSKLYSFQYNDKYHLNLSSFNQPGGPEGKTTYSSDGKSIYISLNSAYCHIMNPLAIAATLLHESIHAKLFEEAKINNPTLSRDDILGIAWNHPKTKDGSHVNMAKNYIKLLAEALRSLDNNRFPIEYYMYLAWSGATQAGKDLGILNNEMESYYYQKNLILLNAPVQFCN